MCRLGVLVLKLLGEGLIKRCGFLGDQEEFDLSRVVLGVYKVFYGWQMT